MRLINKFRSAIRRGTGEAHIIMKSHPEVDFSEEIIYACINDCSYDGQCEGSRGDYLFELISISKQKDIIKKAVLKALAREKDDFWALCQLFDLASLFVLDGDSKARRAIYARYGNDTDWAGEEEIIKLDGFEGLIFIVKKIGNSLKNNPDDWQDGACVSNFQEDNPSVKVWEKLEKLSKSDTDIMRYLDNVANTNTSKEGEETKKGEEGNLIDRILSCKFKYFILKMVKENSSGEDLILIAKRFLKETNIEHKEKLLYVFTEYNYPLDYRPILELAQKCKHKKYEIALYAKLALSNIQAKEIREYALEKLENTTQPAIYTDILKSNYRDGDEKLLIRIAEKFNSECVIESLVCSYIEIYKKNRTPKCQKPLEILYGKMNCGLHREDIVKLMIDNNVLSDKVRNEIIYDSNFDTRKLI